MFIREIRGYPFLISGLSARIRGKALQHRGFMQQFAASKAFKAQNGNIINYTRFSMQDQVSQDLAGSG